MHLRAALAQAGFELLSSSANEHGRVLLYGFVSFVNEHGQLLRFGRRFGRHGDALDMAPGMESARHGAFGAALGAAWRCSTNPTAPPGNCSRPPRRCAMTTG
jgi:hypothetical protein